ncbi:hypothetical protein D3C87_1039710 [compost metagenome]
MLGLTTAEARREGGLRGYDLAIRGIRRGRSLHAKVELEHQPQPVPPFAHAGRPGALLQHRLGRGAALRSRRDDGAGRYPLGPGPTRRGRLRGRGHRVVPALFRQARRSGNRRLRRALQSSRLVRRPRPYGSRRLPRGVARLLPHDQPRARGKGDDLPGLERAQQLPFASQGRRQPLPYQGLLGGWLEGDLADGRPLEGARAPLHDRPRGASRGVEHRLQRDHQPQRLHPGRPTGMDRVGALHGPAAGAGRRRHRRDRDRPLPGYLAPRRRPLVLGLPRRSRQARERSALGLVRQDHHPRGAGLLQLPERPHPQATPDELLPGRSQRGIDGGLVRRGAPVPGRSHAAGSLAA